MLFTIFQNLFERQCIIISFDLDNFYVEVVTYVSPTNVFFTLSIAAVESLEQKSSSQLKPNKNMGLGGACLGQKTNQYTLGIP